MRINSSLVRIVPIGMVIVIAAMGCAAQQAVEPEPEPEAVGEEEYPSRTVEIIIGWGAGGGTDIFTRTVDMYVRREMGVPLVEINMPGASGAKATAYVMEQPADGYTLYAHSTEVLSNPLVDVSPYTHEDLTPIIRAHVDVAALHVLPGTFDTWESFVAEGKKRPLTIGGCGAASSDELSAAMVAEWAGFKFKYVPYEAAGEMHAALLGGHIDAMYEEYSVVLPLIDDGGIQPIFTFKTERLERFPDTVSLGDFNWEQTPLLWRALSVKKGTPEHIVEYLERLYTEALDSQMYKLFARDRLLDLVPGYLGSKDFAADLARETKIYEDVMKELGYID
ncbi:MAG: tripartite tricarboxylate transporter substrate binding protein [Bacillota bacterium]